MSYRQGSAILGGYEPRSSFFSNCRVNNAIARFRSRPSATSSSWRASNRYDGERGYVTILLEDAVFRQGHNNSPGDYDDNSYPAASALIDTRGW